MRAKEGKATPRPATVLGIDAGGTGTRAALVETGIVTERFTSPPLNHRLHDGALDLLCELIERARPSRVGIGLPGMRSASEAHSMATELQARTGVPAAVSHDAEIAQLGAFGGAPGIVVIAGTGSIAWGCDGRGASARAGGHGYLLGDDGGGYWLGAQAVRAALAARDGTGPATRLGEALSEHCHKELDGIVAHVYADPVDRRELSGLVPVLAQVAETDPVAASLLSAAAEHLIALVRAVSARLPAGLPVASAGGVFQVDAIRERVAAATSAVPAAKPPELGAVCLAERRSDDGS